MGQSLCRQTVKKKDAKRHLRSHKEHWEHKKVQGPVLVLLHSANTTLNGLEGRGLPLEASLRQASLSSLVLKACSLLPKQTLCVFS